MGKTQASEQLREAVKRFGLPHVVDLLDGHSRQKVQVWASGSSLPRVDACLEIERVLGIPIAGWGVRLRRRKPAVALRAPTTDPAGASR